MFNQFINELNKVTDKNAFLQKEFVRLKSTVEFPIIQEEKVIFVYYGNAKSVYICGDMTNWIKKIPLKRVTKTNLFYLEQEFEKDARFDYKLVVDNKWILDPLNDKKVGGGFGENSYFKMPDYKENEYSIIKNDVPNGKIHKYFIDSTILNEKRMIQVYLPYNYDPNQKYRVLYFQDGNEYIKLGNATITLDNLIFQKKTEPVVAVFVEPKTRVDDYIYNDGYVNFFVKEMIVFVEKSFNVRNDKKGRVIIGDSLGGFVSSYIVYKNLDIFGGILSHSGAFPLTKLNNFLYRGKIYKGIPFIREIKNVPFDIDWYLVCGRYEKKIAGFFDFTNGNIEFYDALKQNPNFKKIDFKLYNEGHSWGLWKNTLADGLIFLLN